MPGEPAEDDIQCSCEVCASPSGRVCQDELFRRLNEADMLSEEAGERSRRFGKLVAGLPD